MKDFLSMKKDGLYEDAIKVLRERLQTEETGELYHHFAQCHDALGYEKEAVTYYEKALKLGLPDEVKKDTYVCLGSSCQVLEQVEMALQILDQGLSEFPDYPPLHLFRSLVLFSCNQEGAALQEVLYTYLNTTSDRDVTKYRRALQHYAAQLT
ncbi:tetratricopeptide repeat protein [Halobacillus litoralis]|uniref:tetratricopeptide repeat protein n=1 Tax=Halobacillus litoralis TaxID=45668 RepID=UPI001CD74030|nr:tetratricopeptide repeat protein [Halobacillus litoralis]MCA0970262.1 tetratricopeptide repeat protein [Halobacillus litoralis]